VGIAAIYSDEVLTLGGQTLTANIVTMSVFGAIVMYIFSMASLFKLRKTEPGMVRPFRAPLYPVFPAFALLAAVVCLVTMAYYNPLVAGLFVGIVVLGFVYFLLTKGARKEWAPAVDVVESGASA
jgi:ethanolamine permease